MVGSAHFPFDVLVFLGTLDVLNEFDTSITDRMGCDDFSLGKFEPMIA